MTDMIFRDTVRDLAVVAANVNRLVVVPDERLVLLRVFGALRFGWPINLGMPALIGRSGVLLENPVLKSGRLRTGRCRKKQTGGRQHPSFV